MTGGIVLFTDSWLGCPNSCLHLLQKKKPLGIAEKVRTREENLFLLRDLFPENGGEKAERCGSTTIQKRIASSKTAVSLKRTNFRA
jgi:hypothetical protein